jgi:hypothetical protein
MTQTEFNLQAGINSRDVGMELSASAKKAQLEISRHCAEEMARSNNGYCSIDQVQHAMSIKGLSLGMAAGSVFKDGRWDFIGYQKSARVSNHARPVSIWRLKM